MSKWFSAPGESEPDMQPSTEPETDIDSGAQYREELKKRIAQRKVNSASRSEVIVYRPPNRLYQPDFSHKSLADYAEQLTMDLVKNGRMLNTQSRVGIASFVTLDHHLQYAGALGNQLAELLITEVQSFGVPVVDFKMTDKIAVGVAGDMVFSRDARRLAAGQNIDYVLSGTLIENEKGVRVNARVVAMESKVVVSSATLLIPHFVVQALQPRFIAVGE
ncbi:FlgO family outer membrane protein [Aliiglaciecola litoralis]